MREALQPPFDDVRTCTASHTSAETQRRPFPEPQPGQLSGFNTVTKNSSKSTKTQSGSCEISRGQASAKARLKPKEECHLVARNFKGRSRGGSQAYSSAKRSMREACGINSRLSYGPGGVQG